MPVSVKPNFDFKDEIKKRRANLKIQMAKQMTDAQDEIKRRTFTLGQGINGGSLKEYAPSTKKYKISQGKNPNLVNLENTGLLQGALQHQVSEDAKGVTGEIFLSNNRPGGPTNSEIVRRLEEGGRKFFDFSKKQLQTIQTALDEAFRK